MNDGPESIGQSSTSASLRRLAWLMFTPVGVLAAIGIYYLSSDRQLAPQQVHQDSHRFLSEAVQTLQLSNILAPEFTLTNSQIYGLATEI